LEDVAVDDYLALAERVEPGHRAQRPADQALDLVCTARLLAPRGFAPGAGVGRARQHAVFGGHPALAAVAQEGRHALLDRGGAQDVGVAEAHEAGAFGVAGGVELQAHRA